MTTELQALRSSHDALIAALKAIAQRANESGTGELGERETIYAMHEIARAAIARAKWGVDASRPAARYALMADEAARRDGRRDARSERDCAERAEGGVMAEDGAERADDDYLIFSFEHSMWWLHGGIGYTTHLDLAGRYSRAEALRICTQALPGSGSVPNELPVRAADMQILCDRYNGQFGPDVPRPWR